MVTKAQCVAAGSWMSGGESHFHYTGKHDCTRTIGPRGGVKVRITEVRATGKCKTWKTRPDEFKLPIKYGMWEYGYITQDNAGDFHLVSQCPLADNNGNSYVMAADDPAHANDEIQEESTAEIERMAKQEEEFAAACDADSRAIAQGWDLGQNDDLTYCETCKAWVDAEGKVNAQGMYNVCLNCGNELKD